MLRGTKEDLYHKESNNKGILFTFINKGIELKNYTFTAVTNNNNYYGVLLEEAKNEKKTKRHIVKMRENLYVIVIICDICDICDNKISLHFTFIPFFCVIFAVPFSLTTPKDFDCL